MNEFKLFGSGGGAIALSEADVPISTSDGRRRVVIDDVYPLIDGGRYASKACVGDVFDVTCDIFSDGHGALGGAVRYCFGQDDLWVEAPLIAVGNDRWAGAFPLSEQGVYSYEILAWRDPFVTWLYEIRARLAAGQAHEIELLVGRALVADAAASAHSSDERRHFETLLGELDGIGWSEATAQKCLEVLMREDVRQLFARAGPRLHAVTYKPAVGEDLKVRAERKAAVFGSWYELMPRSQSGDIHRHGTFDDVISRLDYVREMGFSVLYLTPIHPIGLKNRKGPNNSLIAGPGDHGSPYAIGSGLGGHDALHPELGDFDDFERLVRAAAERGLEVAMDFAIQCSLDHPWIGEHPEWFEWRADGSIRFAENPPKKYEDIVNVQFYDGAYPSLWVALRDVVLFWINKGVKIFRVDNPHTKPFPFWAWLIADVQERDPDVIFLSEAFTRPKVMRHLAKLGFTQSYTYFTWRTTKQELTEYLIELTQSPSRSYMRPNFFANTPDINPYHLQTGGRAGFRIRLVLAATLSPSYGIYSGFELCEAAAIEGKEEYLDSEKYQLRAWDWDRRGHIRDDIAVINRLRNASPALQRLDTLKFYNAWNDQILYYGKATADRRDFLLFAVNLNPHEAQHADFEVPLWEFGLADDATIAVEDVLTGNRFTWTGKVQHLHLNPNERPYAIWRLYAQEGRS